MNKSPRNFQVGERITITEEDVRIMGNSNRSSAHPGFPSDDYIKRISRFVGKVGRVTHRFAPGYEMTIEFADGDESFFFHAKDSWVTYVPADIQITVAGSSASGKSALIQVINQALKNAGLGDGIAEFSLDGPPVERHPEDLKMCLSSLAARNLRIDIREQQLARIPMVGK
ncbi:hypothetical protein ATN89_17660 [Comamonas thiooxydans]|uniref:hypothetical protein n=1 Tax=Comamonas thiooxydans TaxID=363952 RepID=UPI0007C5333C|nr:hypothetical protein [Comamonas thiooxydans]OAD82909.1 hypothetical protein ATN89_17660 [Comamonas thiooxydans]